ncbi:hypothetical protein ACTQ5A_11810, partial [Bacillota bacterium LCP21S3_F9]
KVISGGDNPYDIHDAKLSSSATAHESSSVTAHEISNRTKSKEITDYLASEQKEPLYVTNDIQLLNGCYYRVIVAYKQEKINGSKKILFVNKWSCVNK